MISEKKSPCLILLHTIDRVLGWDLRINRLKSNIQGHTAFLLAAQSGKLGSKVEWTTNQLLKLDRTVTLAPMSSRLDSVMQVCVGWSL